MLVRGRGARTFLPALASPATLERRGDAAVTPCGHLTRQMGESDPGKVPASSLCANWPWMLPQLPEGSTRMYARRRGSPATFVVDT